jgi:hypothetical protein
LGEKVLFGIAGLFVLFAVLSFIGMEIYRIHSGKKMYAITSHFDFSPEGLRGSERFRDLGCSACHRAVRNGTNNGVNLDGIGSRRTLDYLIAFLHQPEPTYGTRNRGTWRRQGGGLCRAAAGSGPAFAGHLPVGTEGQPGIARCTPAVDSRSGFIDDMVKIWAPSSWKSQYHDVRGRKPSRPSRTRSMTETTVGPAGRSTTANTRA